MSILSVFESLQKSKEFRKREELLFEIPYEVRREFRKFITDSCVDIRDGIMTKVYNVHMEMGCAVEYATSLVEIMTICPEDFTNSKYELRTYLMQEISKFETAMAEIGAEEVLTANYIKFVLEKEYVTPYLEERPQYKEYKDVLITLFYGAVDDVADALEDKYEDIHSMFGFFNDALEEFRK